MLTLESGSDLKLAASVLRFVYAFVVCSFAIVLCVIVSVCSSSICYELNLFKNVFYIALYLVSLFLFLIFFSYIYSPPKPQEPRRQTEAAVSTISSFQPQSSSLKRPIPIGGQALPGLADENAVTYAKLQKPITGQQKGKVWPIGVDENETSLTTRSLPTTLVRDKYPRHTGSCVFSLPETTNVVQKLFVAALALPSMLYSVFRLAIVAELVSDGKMVYCQVSYAELGRLGLLIVMIPVQAFHIFKYGRVFSRKCSLLSAFSLTHWMVTNFATWFEMFISESFRFQDRTIESLNIEKSNSTVAASHGCFDFSTDVKRAMSDASPFLYPLFTQFLILISISILRLIFANAAQNARSKDEDEEEFMFGSLIIDSQGNDSVSMSEANPDGVCECRQSNKGIFVNIFVIFAAISLILAAHFLAPSDYGVTRLSYYAVLTAINSMVILAIPVAWFGISRLDRVPHRDSPGDALRCTHHYNVARFIFTMATLAFLVLYNLALSVIHSALLVKLALRYLKRQQAGLPTELNCVGSDNFFDICEQAGQNPSHFPSLVAAIINSGLAVGRALSTLLLAMGQIAFCILCDCRSALTDKHMAKKPGRALVMFVLAASLISWALEVAFELHTSSVGDTLATLQSLSLARIDIGVTIWPIFAAISVPLSVCFRLCIAIWLYDNWIKCYTPTVI